MSLRLRPRSPFATSLFSALTLGVSLARAQSTAEPALGAQPAAPPGARPAAPQPAAPQPAAPQPAAPQPAAPQPAAPQPAQASPVPAGAQPSLPPQPPPAPPGYAAVPLGYPPPPGYAPPGYYLVPIPEQEPARAATLPYDGGAVPYGYHVESRRHPGMAVGGGITLGSSYGLSLLAGFDANFNDHSAWLALPVFGPWLALASCKTGDSLCARDNHSLLVLDGAAQVTGATLLILAISLPPAKLLVRDRPQFSLSPARLGHTGYGAVLTGSF